MTRHGLMTEIVYEYFTANPGASLDEAAKALDLPSRANVRYHILKLAEAGKMELPKGKHRMFRVLHMKDTWITCSKCGLYHSIYDKECPPF